MKYILSCLIFLSSFIVEAQKRSIQFESGTFAEILAKAKKENKLVFMDAYTTWCGPCKWMAKNIFTKDAVADYYNSNFINAKFDMEKGEGIDIAKKFNVRCYPNLLFFDGDGNLVHRSAGASQNESDYITLGETAKNPNKNYSSLEKTYLQTKDKTPSLIATYIDAIARTCMPYEDVVDLYYQTIQESEMISRMSWNILYNHINNANHKAFTYLLANQASFEKIYSKDSVEQKLAQVFENSGDAILYAKNFVEKDYLDYINKVDQMNFGGKDKVVFNLNLLLLNKKDDLNAYYTYAFKGEKFMNEAQKNDICWNVYEKSDKKEHIDAAINCMKNVTNTPEGKSWMYMDTYASLLYKAKNKSEAQKVANEAIELAKKEGIPSEDYQATEELLKKINKLK
jgi:thiol-disulfide isomerase/thioredoxin